MAQCTRLVKHQGDCEYNPTVASNWEAMPAQDQRCDFHVVITPYNDFLDRFESREE